jgi:acetyl-CoA carboxylase alpha subunit
MSPREKTPTKGSREREIDRLENEVEELRHLAGSVDGDAELERIRQQVAELRREFYQHLGPWQRAVTAMTKPSSQAWRNFMAGPSL